MTGITFVLILHVLHLHSRAAFQYIIMNGFPLFSPTLKLYVALLSLYLDCKLSMLEWQRGSFGRLPYLFPFHFQFHACHVIFVQRVKCYPTPDAPFYRLKAISEFKGNKREEDSIFNTKFSLESIHFRLCFKVFVALEMSVLYEFMLQLQ